MTRSLQVSANQWIAANEGCVLMSVSKKASVRCGRAEAGRRGNARLPHAVSAATARWLPRSLHYSADRALIDPSLSLRTRMEARK